MVKSSRLTHSSFSLREIDFGNFSASPGWEGYYELVDDFEISQVDRAFEVFHEFFKDSLDGFFIMSALSYDDEKENDYEILKKYEEYYNKVKERKLLKPMTPEFEAYLWGDRDIPASFLTFDFSIDFLEPIAKLIMCHSGVVGQSLFFINTSLNIALYPHEDVGFGCISLNNDRNTAASFLGHCQAASGFKVFIDET